MRWWIACSFLVATSACAGGPHADRPTASKETDWTAISIPEGTAGIGFDDIRYVASLDRLLVPAGYTGTLALLRPPGSDLELVRGFAREAAFHGGHDVGPTSADASDGLIAVVDRTARVIDLVDPRTRTLASSSALDAEPDLVRVVASTHECWVTEPEREQIEVFALGPVPATAPARSGIIATAGGPEGLTIDRSRSRAYTHLGPATVALDLKSREVVRRLSSGCEAPSGMALDDAAGLLFVGCANGDVAVLDLSTGRVASRARAGSSVDHIAFNPHSRHLYVPDTRSARLTTFSIGRDHQLAVLGVTATVPGTECVATDEAGHVYLCDPARGRILIVTDRFPSSGTAP